MPTYTPSSVVPQGGDGAVVYSSGALDSFGTDTHLSGASTVRSNVKGARSPRYVGMLV